MNRLKKLRKSKQLSQKEFAVAFNSFLAKREIKTQNGKNKTISYATVSRWENRQPIPDIYYKSLADFFDVPVSYLQGTTSYFRKYQLWLCSKCGKSFWTIEQPKYCPYCRSTKQLGYALFKVISF